MVEPNMLEMARQMRGPDGSGRVFVLDIDHATTKYGISLGIRTTRHAYYLRPPEGMHASDLKKVLDEAGGEETFAFRYFIYPELQMELKPLLTADPFAGKYFDRDDAHRYLQIEGERPIAREQIAQLLGGFKFAFREERFPRLSEFTLRSYRPASKDRHAELILNRKDGLRNEIRKAEPGFHIGVAEHGLAREINIYRPIVAETDPSLILSTNENTTAAGLEFLTDFAAYFESHGYLNHREEPPSAPAIAVETIKAAPLSLNQGPNNLRPVAGTRVVEPPKPDDSKLTQRVTSGINELLPRMKHLRKREAVRDGNEIRVAFPGTFGFGKGPSPDEIKEFGGVLTALQADPSFGPNWKAGFQIDHKTGDLRIRVSYESHLAGEWQPLTAL